MALYEGEELVNVPTPDGRVLQLPRSLAAAVGFAPPAAPLQIGPMSAPMPIAGPQAPPVETLPSALTPAPALPVGPVQNSEDYTLFDDRIDQAADAGYAEAAKREAAERQRAVENQKAATAAAKAQAAYAATPEGMRAGALQEQKAGIADEGGAMASLKQVEEQQGRDIYEAKLRNETDIRRAEEQRAKDAQAAILEDQKKVADLQAQRKKIEDTKIDRDVDHPILAFIAVALSGIGSVIKGESHNPGLDALYKALDRKVAGQMADLEQKNKLYGFQKDELAELRRVASNKLALNNMLVAAETERAARQVDLIASRSVSDRVKAEAQLIAAQLRQRGAALGAAAVENQLEWDQKERHHRDQVWLSKRGQDIGVDQFGKEMAYKYTALGMQTDAAILDAKARGDAKEAERLEKRKEDNRKYGIGDMVTGGMILQPKGHKMLQEAEQLETKAEELAADPWAPKARVDEMRYRASVLRDRAQTEHTWQVLGPESAVKETGDIVRAGQNIKALLDDIKKINSNKAVVGTSKAEQEIKTKVGILGPELIKLYGMGAYDKGVAQKMADLTGGDPTDAFTVNTITSVFGNDPFNTGNLQAIEDIVLQKVQTAAKGGGYEGDARALIASKAAETIAATPQEESVKKISQERTPYERANMIEEEAAKKSTAGKVVERIFYPFGGGPTDPTTVREKASVAENSGSRYGLSEPGQKEADRLVSEYLAGNTPGKNAEKALTQLASDGSRPHVAYAVRALLRDKAPDLHDKLKPLNVNVKLQDVEELKVGAMSGDDKAAIELARRARDSSAKDQAAAANAVIEIGIRNRSKR